METLHPHRDTTYSTSYLAFGFEYSKVQPTSNAFDPNTDHATLAGPVLGPLQAIQEPPPLVN
jgi:hypothetical protein